jgi:hypothetical protein
MSWPEGHGPTLPPEKRIKIGAIEYEIVRTAAQTDAAYGSCDHAKQFIWIDSELGPDQALVTLVHEVLHCIIDQTNLNMERDEEERIVSALAAPVTAFLKDVGADVK